MFYLKICRYLLILVRLEPNRPELKFQKSKRTKKRRDTRARFVNFTLINYTYFSIHTLVNFTFFSKLTIRTGVEGNCRVHWSRERYIDRRLIAWRYERVRAEKVDELTSSPGRGTRQVGRLNIGSGRLSPPRQSDFYADESGSLFGRATRKWIHGGYARRFNTQ